MFKIFTNNNEPYFSKINRNTVPENAYIRLFGKDIATIESISLTENTLKIDHYALDGKFKGKNLGKAPLYSFVGLLSKKFPHVDKIDIQLSRVAGERDEDKVKRLAKARKEFLKSIGAQNISQTNIKEDSIIVSGAWHKNKWPNSNNRKFTYLKALAKLLFTR